ncbi:MAG: aspartate aminotransferase family protein [bacterium]|nr:aspartate aminotransferase family protein [bacterium]
MDINMVIKDENEYIIPTYKRFPVVIVKGKGSRVWDIEGKEYLDFVGGIAVNSLGHCHPLVVNAIKGQAEKLIHTSNLYYTLPQVELAKRIVELCFPGKAFFCNSGAEANEAAIKLARRFGKGRFEIICMQNSFHGRTLATLTATCQEKVQKDFFPLVPGFKCVPFNDLEAIKRSISKETVGVMLEPIQSEGGVWIAEKEYLQDLRKFCDENNLLLIFDEVATGFGRTGKMFCYEHYEVEPDIMTLAKALGGGVAIGAMLAKKDVADFLDAGSHASTFGGNPLVCSAALASINTISEENLVKNSENLGYYFLERLNALRERYNFIKDVRGKGLLIGVELTFKGEGIVNECLNRGVLINCIQGNVLRFLPPLNITKEDIDKVIDTLEKVFNVSRETK